MLSRALVLSAFLLATMSPARPIYAAGAQSRRLVGTCSTGEISESDGVQVRPAGGPMSTKDFLAVMKRARESHLTLGSDGFLWKTEPLHCDSVAVAQMDDYKGHRMVTFSNGDPSNPILAFAGGLADGDGTMLFASTVYLADGKAIPLQASGPNGPWCQFFYTRAGEVPAGLGPISPYQLAVNRSWETRITGIACEMRVKTETGHLIQASVKFNATQSPPVAQVSRDPLTSKP